MSSCASPHYRPDHSLRSADGPICSCGHVLNGYCVAMDGEQKWWLWMIAMGLVAGLGVAVIDAWRTPRTPCQCVEVDK
jgi:hypothetical protein